jgi:hypothetical protein
MMLEWPRILGPDVLLVAVDSAARHDVIDAAGNNG